MVSTGDGTVVLAGQACYTAGEWDGDPDALEGRSGAPDPAAYDASVERLRALDPARVYFAHDRGCLDLRARRRGPRLLSFRGRARRGTSGAL